MIKLIAVDMDGTLLNSEGRISRRNAYAVQCLQALGTEFLVCTGRSYEDALLPLKERGIRASVICMNGSCIYDWNGRLADKTVFQTEQVKQILRAGKEFGAVFDFMTSRGSFSISTEEEFRDAYERDILLPMAAYSYEAVRDRFHLVREEELFSLGLEFFKISVLHASSQTLNDLKERLKEIENLAVASSFYTNLELTHKDAQKGKALSAYASVRGIRLDEIMAIGDSENDTSMLSMGLKYTIAMGNAMESVKKTAKCLTRTNDEDGVAYAVETLILSQEARSRG